MDDEEVEAVQVAASVKTVGKEGEEEKENAQ